tara:strand:- start:49 stop:324 length:276 start_codon:yes stop_codon:yes gene_type:complete
MKIFIYKTIIVTFSFFLLFEILIGRRINAVKNEIYQLTSKKKIEEFRDKVIKEIKKGTEKEKYFTKEESIVISNFLYKINSELSKDQTKKK